MKANLNYAPSGFKTAPYRSIDATVFIVEEGSGKSRIGDTVLDWKKRDIFVMPSWHSTIHESNEETVLFSFSDRAVQKALGLWREQNLE